MFYVAHEVWGPGRVVLDSTLTRCVHWSYKIVFFPRGVPGLKTKMIERPKETAGLADGRGREVPG